MQAPAAAGLYHRLLCGGCRQGRSLHAAQRQENGTDFPENPKGVELNLRVEEISMGPEAVSCAIEKDSGDDPDITKGTLIFATVQKSQMPGISIDGGTGIGRVTKRGPDQPVGNAAINSVPRQMIREKVERVCKALDDCGGLSAVISAPEGEMLAKKTFNPRLGIVGGSSLLGTTGIVESMSEQALVDTIRVELRQRRANGGETLLTPGNYGFDFLREELGLDPPHIAVLLGCVTCDEALRILKEQNCMDQTLSRLTGRTGFHLAQRGDFDQKLEAVRQAGARLVVIDRPPQSAGKTFAQITPWLCGAFGFSRIPEVSVVGIVPGSRKLMTGEAKTAISHAVCLIGAKRMTESVKNGETPCFSAIAPAETAEIIRENPQYQKFAVLMSGNTGFYSGTRKLLTVARSRKAGSYHLMTGHNPIYIFTMQGGKNR